MYIHTYIHVHAYIHMYVRTCTYICLFIYPHSSIHRDSVKCNSVTRLQNLSTQLFLHSHKFTSPLSGNQEVSAFGSGGKGDRGNWTTGYNYTCTHVDG